MGCKGKNNTSFRPRRWAERGGGSNANQKSIIHRAAKRVCCGFFQSFQIHRCKKPKAAAKPKGTKTTAKRTAAKQQYKLVIVESPAKAKTIQKYLGKGYQVMASMGHVRDLPKSRLGVDIEHDFAPEYIDIRGKGQLRNELKKAAKHASFVYLATDPDLRGRGNLLAPVEYAGFRWRGKKPRYL